MTVALVWGLTAVGVVLVIGFCFRVAAGMVHVEGATFGRAMLSALFSAIVAAAVAVTVAIETRNFAKTQIQRQVVKHEKPHTLPCTKK